MPTYEEALCDPILSQKWGCESLSQKLTKGKMQKYPCLQIGIGGVVYKFYRHPELFLMPHIASMVREITYNEENNVKIEHYKKVKSKYITCKRIYQRAFQSALKLKEAFNNGK